MAGFLHVRENWKKSGNLCGQGKVREKYYLSQGKLSSIMQTADICDFLCPQMLKSRKICGFH